MTIGRPEPAIDLAKFRTRFSGRPLSPRSRCPHVQGCMNFPRYNVLGVGVSALTLAQARDAIVGLRGELRRGYVCLGTAHGLTEAQRDPELKRVYNESWLTTPDGMPLVWLGPRGIERVY